MSSTTRNVFFIDSRVSDYQTLVAALPDGSEWFLLDSTKDGVEQMATILSRYTKLDSIQILSHGDVGTLYLGNTVLNYENLNTYQDMLQEIGTSLTETGDMLLYGCNVAQGDLGKVFVSKLAAITSSDVAASTNRTGSGGDWILENTSESVGSQSITSEQYGGTLNVITGDAGHNILTGGDGNDIIYGGLGNDTLDGGYGFDTLDGGGGIDTADYRFYGGPIVANLATGVVAFPGNSNLTDTLISIENLISGNGNDTITGTGSANAIFTSYGNDVLKGAGGNDTLGGGIGNDTLTGGAGSDTFRFGAANEGIDLIKDFNSGIDKIQIDGSGFNINSLWFTFSGTKLPTPTKSEPFLLYNKSNGELWYDSDGTGSTQAVQIAKLGWSLLTDTRTLLATDIAFTGDASTHLLSTTQSNLIKSLKASFNDAFSHIANVSPGVNGYLPNSNLSGQCVSYVKNARADLNHPWNEGAIDGLTTFSSTTHIETTIPVIGSAFVLNPSAKIVPYSGNATNLVGHSVYGHTGIVTSVEILRSVDASGHIDYFLEVGVRDSNRAGEFKATSASKADDETEANAAMRESTIKLALTETGDQTKIAFISDKVSDHDLELTNIQAVIGKLYDANLISHSLDKATVLGTENLINAFYLLNTQDKWENYLNLIELKNVEKSGAPTVIQISISDIQVKDVLAGAKVGTSSNDKILGGSDNDIFYGGAGQDILTGAGGNDTLSGGLGSDDLTGGAGKDIFIFDAVASVSNIDTIKDFAHGTDKIMLKDDYYKVGVTGTIDGVTLGADRFSLGSAAGDTTDRVIYDQSTGKLYYDPDGSGAGAQVQFALLGTGTTHPTLSAADFLVIA